MKFEELFVESDNGNDQNCDDFNINAQILSPPMSMPANSLKNTFDDFMIQNESEIREALFVNRMRGSPEKAPEICKNELFIRFDQKPVEKAQICVSHVKLRLNSIPKTDEAFLRKGLSRRIKRMKCLETSKTNTEEQDEYLEYYNYEVW